MRKDCRIFAALLFLALSSAALPQGLPSQIGLRYSEQLSNGPAGECGCFTLQGAAADANWKIGHFIRGLGLAADAGVENTRNANGAGYGLTLTTIAAGPRFQLRSGKLQPFAQALFGLAHGSGSEFPQGDMIEHSANSFDLDLGAGADYRLNKLLSARFLQVDYLRTALPNNSTNWQNNLRIGAGLTLNFPH